MPYTIRYSAAAERHLNNLTARVRANVRAAIKQRLAYQPLETSANRKSLKPDPDYPFVYWELRLGDIRVFYRVEDEMLIVVVIAVGSKDRERVYIDREVVPSTQLIELLTEME